MSPRAHRPRREMTHRGGDDWQVSRVSAKRQLGD